MPICTWRSSRGLNWVSAVLCSKRLALSALIHQPLLIFFSFVSSSASSPSYLFRLCFVNFSLAPVRPSYLYVIYWKSMQGNKQRWETCSRLLFVFVVEKSLGTHRRGTNRMLRSEEVLEPFVFFLHSYRIKSNIYIYVCVCVCVCVHIHTQWYLG